MFKAFSVSILFSSGLAAAHQHQPQKIQQDKYDCKNHYLLQIYRRSGDEHETVVKNAADTAGFHRTDKKFS